jgi:glycogen(starch) synthase
MRLLILSNLFPPGFMGGYELGAAEVAAGLIRRGHTVDVLTSSFFADDTGADRGGALTPVIHRSLDCAEPNRSPLDVIDRVWFGAFALPRNLRELAGRLATIQPDAVLCFNLAGLGAPSMLRLLTASGMRPVVYLMDHIFATMCVDPTRRRAFERIFSTADWPETARVMFMSQSLREEIEAALGRVIPHGQIVPGWFDARAAIAITPRDTAATRFVFASRIAPHKGVDILLDACRSLLDTGCSNFAVDIFGAGEVATMVQRITALRLQEHVRYRGAPQKPDLMAQLGDYDSLLFPTMPREPFGFIVAEAAVAGCIPIMTVGIGAAEWFLDGLDCLKTDRDSAGLHAAMLKLVSMTGAARAEMRRRAQATAQRFLRFEDALTRIEATLAEAASPPTRNPRAMEGALAVLTELWRARPHG